MVRRKHKLVITLLLWLLLPLFVCLFSGCSSDDNELDSNPTPVKFSLLISSPEMESAVISYASEGEQVDTRFLSHFNDRFDMIIIKGIHDGFAFAPAFDKLCCLQSSELM